MNTFATKDGTEIYFKDWGKVYPGAPHAIISTAKSEVSEDLLAFIRK